MTRRPAPTLEQLTAAVELALDVACIDVTVTQDGHPADLARLVACLDRHGLIDWKAIR